MQRKKTPVFINTFVEIRFCNQLCNFITQKADWKKDSKVCFDCYFMPLSFCMNLQSLREMTRDKWNVHMFFVPLLIAGINTNTRSLFFDSIQFIQIFLHANITITHCTRHWMRVRTRSSSIQHKVRSIYRNILENNQSCHCYVFHSDT